MSLQQNSQIAPPSPTDGMLHDFAQIIQDNFIVLFQAAHFHKIVTTLPTIRDGSSGDIYILNDGTIFAHWLRLAPHGTSLMPTHKYKESLWV